MGKRSTFPRRPMDDYATPYEAVVPLVAHLRAEGIHSFAEPCCGDGDLVRIWKVWASIASTPAISAKAPMRFPFPIFRATPSSPTRHGRANFFILSSHISGDQADLAAV